MHIVTTINIGWALELYNSEVMILFVDNALKYYYCIVGYR